MTDDRIQEYSILLATDPSSLSSQVNALIAKGWRPQGGVSQSTVNEEGEGEQTQWAQAMVKASDA